MYKKLFIFLTSIIVSVFFVCIGVTLYNRLGFGIPCTFHELTGLYCAGCGMTRAVSALNRLEFYQAFRYNIFVFIALPFLAIYFLVEGYYWVLNRKNRFEPVFHVLAFFILISLVMYGFLRNVPLFAYLVPTDIV